MPFFGKTFAELTADAIQDLGLSTNLTRLSAGGKARAMLEAVNRRLEEAYSVFDINMAHAFVSSASGQWLDLIGVLLGISRLPAVAAVATNDIEIIKFYVENNANFGSINAGNGFSITRGTLLSTEANSTGILYRVIADKIIAANETVAYVSAQAISPGEESNVGTGALSYHNFTGYTDYLNNTLRITNLHPIANGKSIESDTNFRYRIVNQTLVAEAANETAIRLAGLSTPGVADIITIPRYRGIGTFGAIIKSVQPVVSQNLIDQVTANILKVQGFGTLAYIRGPKETGVSMEITTEYKQTLSETELQDIEARLEETIRAYVNGLDLGESLIINRMISELFDISDKINNFGVDVYKPVDYLYVYKQNYLADNKVRQLLIGDYVPDSTDERVIIEPSLVTPIVLRRKFVKR